MGAGDRSAQLGRSPLPRRGYAPDMRWGGVLAVMAVVALGFPGAASAQDDGPDGEVVALLQELIRANTSNPPGNEAQIAELLRTRLEPLGFEVEIVPTPTPGKAHLIARLRAQNPTAKPLLLAGHEDVVGVERELWSVDPFAGVLRGGDIFGRGAMDFKGGLAAFTVAASRIARAKVPLSATSSCSPRPTRRAATTARAGWRRPTSRRSTPASRSTRAAGSSRTAAGPRA